MRLGQPEFQPLQCRRQIRRSRLRRPLPPEHRRQARADDLGRRPAPRLKRRLRRPRRPWDRQPPRPPLLGRQADVAAGHRRDRPARAWSGSTRPRRRNIRSRRAPHDDDRLLSVLCWPNAATCGVTISKSFGHPTVATPRVKCLGRLLPSSLSDSPATSTDVAAPGRIHLRPRSGAKRHPTPFAARGDRRPREVARVDRARSSLDPNCGRIDEDRDDGHGRPAPLHAAHQREVPVVRARRIVGTNPTIFLHAGRAAAQAPSSRARDSRYPSAVALLARREVIFERSVLGPAARSPRSRDSVKVGVAPHELRGRVPGACR